MYFRNNYIFVVMENTKPYLEEDSAIQDEKPNVCPSSLIDDHEDLELDVQPENPNQL